MILSRPFVNKRLHPNHNCPPSCSQTPDFKDSEFIYSCLSSGLLELLMARHRFALSSGVCSARRMCCPQERFAHVPLLRRVSLTAVRSAHVPELPPVSLAAETLKTQQKHTREVSCLLLRGFSWENQANLCSLRKSDMNSTTFSKNKWSELPLTFNVCPKSPLNKSRIRTGGCQGVFFLGVLWSSRWKWWSTSTPLSPQQQQHMIWGWHAFATSILELVMSELINSSH